MYSTCRNVKRGVGVTEHVPASALASNRFPDAVGSGEDERTGRPVSDLFNPLRLRGPLWRSRRERLPLG